MIFLKEKNNEKLNNFQISSCRNKELLEASTRFIQTFEEDVATLIIEHPKPKDSGEYKCVVINTAGEDVCTAKLTVTGIICGSTTTCSASVINKFVVH